MEINEKKIKEVLKEQREEYQRYLGVAVEHFDFEVKVIAEQYTDIKETLGSHTKILDSHTKILDLHTKTLDSHTKTLELHTKILDSHTRTLDSHTEMIGSMKIDIEIIKTDIEFIKNSLKRKVDLEEFEALEKRVRFLESKARS